MQALMPSIWKSPNSGHVVETEYYIDRAGNYTAGTCTVQCAYSPEFSGRASGMELKVVK